MDTFSASLTFCVGIHRSPVGSQHKGPVELSLDVFFVVSLDKLWTNRRVVGDLTRHEAQAM